MRCLFLSLDGPSQLMKITEDPCYSMHAIGTVDE